MTQTVIFLLHKHEALISDAHHPMGVVDCTQKISTCWGRGRRVLTACWPGSLDYWWTWGSVSTCLKHGSGAWPRKTLDNMHVGVHLQTVHHKGKAWEQGRGNLANTSDTREQRQSIGCLLLFVCLSLYLFICVCTHAPAFIHACAYEYACAYECTGPFEIQVKIY